jgi:1-acyl-sn-glycerol-3-phosphate acyltransferase
VLVEQGFRLWRVLGTGLSFAVFGVGALGLALVAFPLCHLVPGDARAKEARVQRVIHYAYRFFIGFMETLGLIRTEWVGAERLSAPGPHLVIANHPTLIDVVHVISRLPQADCVISDEYARNPFLGFAASWAGYITNARGAEVVDACVERLRAGRSVVLFPEGTRSPRDGMHPFRRGAAHVALRAGVPLEPVAISCAPSMLCKGQPWWDVPERPGRFTICVLDSIEPPATGASNRSDVLAARRLTVALRERIRERLCRVGLR